MRCRYSRRSGRASTANESPLLCPAEYYCVGGCIEPLPCSWLQTSEAGASVRRHSLARPRGRRLHLWRARTYLLTTGTYALVRTGMRARQVVLDRHGGGWTRWLGDPCAVDLGCRGAGEAQVDRHREAANQEGALDTRAAGRPCLWRILIASICLISCHELHHLIDRSSDRTLLNLMLSRALCLSISGSVPSFFIDVCLMESYRESRLSILLSVCLCTNRSNLSMYIG